MGSPSRRVSAPGAFDFFYQSRVMFPGSGGTLSENCANETSHARISSGVRAAETGGLDDKS